MGKLAVTEFVSVDGVLEDPGGAEDYEHGGWTFEYDRGDEGNKFKMDELMEAKVQLLGRTTYEGFAEVKEETDGNILVSGSGTLVATLLENDLVDELRLMVFPTVLGRGRRLF